MGQSESAEKKHAVVDNSNNVHDVSNGTHFVEIHMPTAGFGMGTILMIAGIFYLVYRCRRAARKNRQKKEEAKEMRAARMLALMGGHDDQLSWLEHGVGYAPRLPKFHWPSRPSRFFPSSCRFEELGETPPAQTRAQARGLQASDLHATEAQDSSRSSTRPAMADLDR